MPKYDSIPVAEARRLVQSGDALLVCAYESEEKFKKTALKELFHFRNSRKRKVNSPGTKRLSSIATEKAMHPLLVEQKNLPIKDSATSRFSMAVPTPGRMKAIPLCSEPGHFV